MPLMHALVREKQVAIFFQLQRAFCPARFRGCSSHTRFKFSFWRLAEIDLAQTLVQLAITSVVPRRGLRSAGVS